ncbi:MAG: hypothetical protein ACK53Y_23305, partial [bacterium]
PYSSGLFLRHVDVPCPRALGGLPLAGHVGFPLLNCPRCREPTGSVGFPLPTLSGSYNIPWLLARQAVGAVVLPLPVLLRPYHAAGVSLAPSYLWTLVLRLSHLAAKPGTLRGRQARLPCFETGDQSALKRLTPAFEAPLLSPPSGML